MSKLYLMIVVTIVVLNSCAADNVVDLYSAKVETFEDAVNANSDVNLLPIISESTNDYDVINVGEYFANGDGTIFVEYLFDYYSCSSVIDGTSTTTSCSVNATNRSDGLAVSYAITATFSFIFENNDWKIIELKQTRQTNEEVLLDELNDAENRLLEFLERSDNGKVLD